VKVWPLATIVWAFTTIRPETPERLVPVKSIREPSLAVARSCSPISGGNSTAVPSFRMNPLISPFGPELMALMLPRRE
jgi:hypothetical protein